MESQPIDAVTEFSVGATSSTLKEKQLRNGTKAFLEASTQLLPKPVGSREKPLMLFLALLLMKKCCPAVIKLGAEAAATVLQDLAVICCQINKNLHLPHHRTRTCCVIYQSNCSDVTMDV